MRWDRPSQPVVGPVSAAAKSQQFPPLPGLSAVRQSRLRKGGLPDLQAVYGGLGSGRMVIVGAPGSGKSGALARLQDRLAGQANKATSPERQAAGTSL